MQELEVFTCPLEDVIHIEASAGTGKTWTICALYIRLLLEKGFTVAQILVVTFTRAATAELQSRIRSRLAQVLYVLECTQGEQSEIPASEDIFIHGLLTQVLGVRIAQKEARLRLEQAIQDFDQAAICTIHSFCQRALQEAPFAAGRPFECTLQEDDTALRTETALAFWRQVVEPAAARYPGFCAWLLAQGASPQSLDQELQQWQRKPLAMVKFPPVERGCTAPASTQSSKSTLYMEWEYLLDHTLELHSALTDSFAQAHMLWKQEETFLLDVLHAALPNLHGRFYTVETVEQARVAWANYFTHNGVATHSPAPEAKSTLFCSEVLASRTKKGKAVPEHAFFMQAEAWWSQYRALDAAYAQVWLGLLRIWRQEGPAALAARKQTQGVMSFDDLLSMVHEALQTQPAFVQALKARYRAALIDEFQDTDPLQWSIFQQIFAQDSAHSAVIEPVSTPIPTLIPATEQWAMGDAPVSTASIENPSLFLIGDPKQAIYSFRAADVHTYLAARARAKARYTLGTNQRSTEGLVAACNRIFTVHPKAFVQKGLDYQAVQAGAAQRLGQARSPGGVDEVSDPSEKGLWIWHLPKAPILSKQKALQAAASACAAEIARLLTMGDAALPSLAPSDIAVLVKTHAQGHYIKEILGQWGIASIEMTPESVLSSRSAEELEYLMRALHTPQNIACLRAALSLDWFGFDAKTLAAWSDAEGTLSAQAGNGSVDAAAVWVERFLHYRALWEKKGWALMWETLTKERGILPRIAASPDGERRLTDLMHINELIVMRTASHLGDQSTMMSVMRWFIQERHYPHSDANQTQLRLESDRECVQILTIHRAKGLEYKVVWCPFLYEGGLRGRSPTSGRLPKAREYHDASGQAVLDYGFIGDAQDDALQEEEREAAQSEAIGAESVRLIYVALTRAVYRCYLVAGLYTHAQGASTKEARQSMLNWLVAAPHPQGLPQEFARDVQKTEKKAQDPKRGNDATDHLLEEEVSAYRSTFREWIKKPPETDAIDAAWQALCSEAIRHAALPQQDSIVAVPTDVARFAAQSTPTRNGLPRARQMQRSLYFAGEIGKITSFSALTQHLPSVEPLTHSHTASQQEEEALWEMHSEEAGFEAHHAVHADDDMVHFPRGAAAGVCLHRLFELADFAHPASWPDCIAHTLSDPFFSIQGAGPANGRWTAVMMRLLHNVAHTPLEQVAPGFTLAQLPIARRRIEFEFLFPATIQITQLAPLFAEYGYADLAMLIGTPSHLLPFEAYGHRAAERFVQPGYVRGFIDVVFEHAGRFWIIDWKSNDLGDQPADYSRDALQRAMGAHRYHVQASLYTLALHRYLQHYLPGYQYETHFGGYAYLFVRGMRPNWQYHEQACGIYAHKPDVRFIALLDRKIGC